MNPLDWRARARNVLTAAGERCFVRFARPDEGVLFCTDAQDTAPLEAAGFCVRERRGRVCGFDVPDAWYAAMADCMPERATPEDERGAQLLALWHRLSLAARGDAPATDVPPMDAGRAFWRAVARGCFAPGGVNARTMAALRAQAAILQRKKDTGALAAAAGLVAAALNQEG